ncbi:peptide deformylase [Romboutsia lituseburensis]|uniref:Peptide deformylase n=2 Tax=root TaxID=1 RepID=A0A1G9QC07_9FIRM|nr:peptide deformylase [Romboutsia lituseburensis]MCR8745299.1 peptide deformylase [Romboutsia lituseburensis]CEH35445.1 Peptide deformylase [Romboutsia lituseburensis]SDM08612.1 peptide deformylase [Romboutsia lituseburensis DSM 797]
MALREIVQIGEPVLRKKSKVVEKIDDKLIQLLDDMAETMYQADGVGLAAPQVGVLKRVVVIDIGDGIIELINPEIIETSGEQIGDEGCLSVLGESGEVRRPYVVKVRAFNRKGQLFEIEGEELLARAFCHEIDHLEGVLFVDKIEK